MIMYVFSFPNFNIQKDLKQKITTIEMVSQ